jgi:hypothetical protein
MSGISMSGIIEHHQTSIHQTSIPVQHQHIFRTNFQDQLTGDQPSVQYGHLNVATGDGGLLEFCSFRAVTFLYAGQNNIIPATVATLGVAVTAAVGLAAAALEASIAESVSANGGTAAVGLAAAALEASIAESVNANGGSVAVGLAAAALEASIVATTAAQAYNGPTLIDAPINIAPILASTAQLAQLTHASGTKFRAHHFLATHTLTTCFFWALGVHAHRIGGLPLTLAPGYVAAARAVDSNGGLDSNFDHTLEIFEELFDGYQW